MVERIDDIFKGFGNDDTVSNFTVFHEVWPRFSTISPVKLDSIFDPQPCILAGVNAQPRGVLKRLSDKSDLRLADFENNHLRPLINITKGPDYSVTREF